MVFSSLTVVMDNRAREGFRSSWGLSLLLVGDIKVLFDAGPSGDDLLYNLALCGYKPSDIDVFFLSHSHIDHSGGLRGLQEAGFAGETMLSDYVPRADAGARLHMGDGLCPLLPGLTAIRLDSGGLHEQSLLAETPLGPLLLVGCAHPGLENIWESACSMAVPIGVVGGFHDSPPFATLGSVRFLGPCHCTKQREAFLQRFPSSFIDLAAGDHLDFERTDS